MTPDGQSHTVPRAGAQSDSVVETVTGAFVSDAVSSALRATSGTGDSQVSTAFALGWRMAEFYRPNRLRHSRSTSDDDLPGLGSLNAAEEKELGITAIKAGLARLEAVVTPCGLTLPNVDDFACCVSQTGSDDDRASVIRKFHVEILTALTAADSKLGKAYGLGRALADTCIKPTDFDSLRAELRHYRIETLRAWIEDLASAFPAHVGGSVSQSLGAWSAWADETQKTHDEALLLIREQGRLWRSLMSGEKSATDMLTADAYLTAGTAFLRETQKLARNVLRRHIVVCICGALLFGGGIALMLVVDSSASIVAGLSVVTASLGVSWRTIGNSLGQAVGKLEQPAWGGALDAEVADAITLIPGRSTPATYRDRDPQEIQYESPDK
jgi:hypothetical protein